MLERITSRHNSLVQQYQQAARRRPGGDEEVLLEGLRLLREARAARLPIRAVAFDRATLAQVETGEGELLAELAREGARVARVSDSVMRVMSPAATPSGVVAIAEHRAVTLEASVERFPALLIVASAIQDPGNLGAVIRAAEAGGATGVVVTGSSADPLGWKALRGSMGSAFRLPVARVPDLEQTISVLEHHSIRSIAALPRGGASLYEVDLRGPTAIIIGSEGLGLPAAVLRLADGSLSIPMQPGVESLNVAVASALVVYEALRQRLRRPAAAGAPGPAPASGGKRTRAHP